jgi:multicomponent Na+:H+ antiporter subunit C
MTVLLAACAAALFAVGTYLVLQRKLSRTIVGLGLLTHGANLLLIGAGRRGSPPIIGFGDVGSFSDPLPQALALTAIVISFAVTTLLLSLAYRSWQLTHDDEVEDDIGDREIGRARILDEEIHDQETAMTDGVGDPAP